MVAVITDSAQQIAATSSFYVVVFLSVSSSCRSAGNFWSRLQLPASVLPLFEVLFLCEPTIQEMEFYESIELYYEFIHTYQVCSSYFSIWIHFDVLKA
ncbi:putative RPN5 26S proteasome regulatory subunit [Prunus dulcis]|uniref:Putative RPN5 26S proteasome regulatory subunit n=1 Tax=Prunus dulcis TaxID=3755 RepID=A0A4Y1RY53_PRUDU|nr:putative RPN5 26S proteasome regulatory subunit [Prunus dulcis]